MNSGVFHLNRRCLRIAAAGMLLLGCSPAGHTVEQAGGRQTEVGERTEAVPVQDGSALKMAATKEGEDAMMKQASDPMGYEVDEFVTPGGKKVIFHAIKHGSLRIEYDGLEFEADPVRDLNGRTTDYAAFPDADYILVTHEHFDHFDPAAIGALEKDGTVLITNARCAEQLGRGEIMANGDSRTLREDIRIEAVPAYNTTAGHEKFHPKGRDNGFVLTLDGFRIYIAGDTEDIPEMASIRPVDVAFLPCNQPYTMTPEQLRHAADMIQPKVLFPYHYGETSMDAVRALFESSATDLRIRHYE